MRRLALKALAAIVVFAAIAFAAGYAYLRRSLPTVNGAVAVAGLSGRVDIVRDADDVPHIFATTKHDALFGLGYVHAQDRLWQMEFQRRIGFGRLSEMFGAAALPQDRFLRTVGFGRAATAAWERAPEWVKQQVNAYVAGVNAFIATHHGAALPPEFSLLRVEPEPWTGPDVVVWVKMMAWDLSANYSFELLRNDMVRAVGVERMAKLMPPYPANGLSITGGFDQTGDAAGQHAMARAVRPIPPFEPLPPALPFLPDFVAPAPDGAGSNNWVVDGTMTASGKPMLANDPHLGTRIPSTWYLAHMSAPDFDVIGGTLPGTPAVVLGRNRRIAWGMTNVAADVQDLFREHLDPSGTTAEFKGAQEPITIVPETIKVKGAPDVILNVRVTRHGPLVSDALNANAAASTRTPKPAPLEPLAFRWTALDPDDTTMLAVLKVNEARNWTEFVDALKSFVVPSQNFVYADVDGHIGYYAPGHIPIRASGDGTLPADGWTGDAEWTGSVPFDELPHLYDPPDHFIVTANHRPEPADYRYNLGVEWYEPYRAQRIVDLLRGRTKLTPDDFARIQADTVSLHAKELLPILLQHVRPEDDRERRAIELLREWNFDATAGSAATAIFEAWFYQLAPAFVGQELGPLVTETYNGKSTFVTRFLIDTLNSRGAAWGLDAGACDTLVTKALHDGLDDLATRMGSDMTRWRWDTIHHAVLPHQGLDAVAALRPLLSRSIASAGDWSTVDVGTVDASAKYEQHLIPGYREIIDLSPANDSRFADAVGQSGHFLSPHYDDRLTDWQQVRHLPMRMTREAVEHGATGHLALTPR
ncbi:MAG TPA: penicillin acylase family protein [Vicinamibacterales bacterium]|nr:penicillin acylase family protein [Vicinamibacterales bacterium]